MGVTFQALRLFSHWLECQSHHSLHSPALFQFYSDIISKDSVFPWMHSIEKSRLKLLKSADQVTSIDFGSDELSIHRSIKHVARTSLSPSRWSRLLYRVINYTESKLILELGTSLGINTLYLSEDSSVKVCTMEGNPILSEKASALFKEHGRKNIELINGNIDQHLIPTLEKLGNLDLAFLDANHRYEPTMVYAKAIWSTIKPGGFLIADDINRSPDMRKAWMELRNFKDTSVSVDLFRWGLIQKGPSALAGQHIWCYGSLLKP